MDAISRSDAEQLLRRSEEELFEMLVPAGQQAYSRRGKAAKGRSIFQSRLTDIRGIVCPIYNGRKKNTENSIEMAVLVASGLLASPLLAGIPVLPLAALLVKIGLEELCVPGKKEKGSDE